jgi:tRNA(Ile)-lysidine synthase
MQLTPPAGDDIRLVHWVGRAFPDRPLRIGIAVSGGGDSMALLHMFARWSQQTGHPIAAVTVDHGLRDGSDREAQGVADYCAKLNIPHDTLLWNNWDGHGNLQAAARDARYRLMAEWAQANGVGGIALGHTMDDGAETFLMRLSRKAGVDGLSAMDRVFTRNGVTYARPLWMCSRTELRDYLTRNDVTWVNDPSNDDVDFERIRVRQAMTALDELGLRNDALQHAATALREARSALDYYTAKEAATHVLAEAGDLIMPLKPDVPDEIARRLRSKVIQWMGQLPYPPRGAAMQHLMDGLALEGTHTLGGAIVTVKGGTMRVMREANAVRQMTCATDAIWDGRWALDGPHAPDLHIGSLGDGITQCPDWRDAGLPRLSLLASPAIWQATTLIAAPLAGFSNGWQAHNVADFHSSLVAH